jgi:tetratricopeptide (TPR) repeat protein
MGRSPQPTCSIPDLANRRNHIIDHSKLIMATLGTLSSKLKSVFQKSSEASKGVDDMMGAVLLVTASVGGPAAATPLIAIQVIIKSLKGCNAIFEALAERRRKGLDGTSSNEIIDLCFHIACQQAFLQAAMQQLERIPLHLRQRRVDNTFKELSRKPIVSISTSFKGGYLDLRESHNFFSVYSDRSAAVLHAYYPKLGTTESIRASLLTEAAALLENIVTQSPELNAFFTKQSQQKIESKLDETLSLLKRINQAEADTPSSRGPIDILEPQAGGPPPSLSGPAFRVSPVDDSGYGRITAQIREEFEGARKELQEGSATKAEILFRNIANILEKDPTSDAIVLRARCLSNVGISLHRRNQNTEACRYFSEAYKLAPAHPNISTLFALSKLLNNEHAAAQALVEQQLLRGENSEMAVNLLVEIHLKNGNTELAHGVLAENRSDSEAWLLNETKIYLAENEWSKAEAVARQGLAIHSGSEMLKECLGYSIAFPYLAQKARPHFVINERDLERFVEAERLLEEAVVVFRLQDTVVELLIALSNLAAIKSKLGKDEEALQLLQESLALDHNDLASLRNVVVVNLHLGKKRESLESARRLHSLAPNLDNVGILVQALIVSKHYSEALGFIDSVKHPLEERDDAFFQIAKLDIYQSRRQTTLAATHALELEKRFPESPLVLTALAQYYYDKAEIDRGVGFLRTAIACSEPDEADLAKSQLGYYYYRMGLWEDALNLLSEAISKPAGSPFFEEMCHCYYELGLYSKLFELTQEKDLSILTPFALRILGHAYLKSSNLEQARDVLERLIDQSADLATRCNLAIIHHRLGSSERAYDIFLDAHWEDPKNLQILINLAGACQTLGRPREGFDFVLKAYDLDPGSEAVTSAICSFALGSGELDLSESEKFLVHQCLETSPSVKKVEFVLTSDGKIDPQPFLEIIRKNDRASKKLLKKYHKAQAPLYLFSKASKQSIWDAWLAMSESEQGAIYAESGSHEDQEREFQLALKAEIVAVDLVALMTLAALGHLDLLRRRFSGIFLSVAEFENIIQTAREKRIFDLNRTSGHLYEEGDKLRFVTADQATLLEKWRVFEELESFVQEPFTRKVGIHPTLFEDQDLQEQLSDLDDLLFFPLAVSKGENVPLLSDQLLVRRACKDIFVGDAFCVREFLRSCCELDLLSADEFYRCVNWLIAHNYKFTPHSFEALYSHCLRSGFVADTFTLGILERIVTDPWRNEKTAQVAGIGIAKVWAHSSLAGGGRSSFAHQIALVLSRKECTYELLFNFFCGTIIYLLRQPNMVFGMYFEVVACNEATPDLRSRIKLLIQMACNSIRRVDVMKGALDPHVVQEWAKQVNCSALLMRSFGVF